LAIFEEWPKGNSMIENRELNIDDYLAMLRRRMKVILIPTLLAPLVGFLVSFAFSPKYTSQSLVLVEEQKVPAGYVKPVVTEDIAQRIATMQQQVLSRARLQPLVDRLGLARGRSVDEAVDEIRQNLSIDPVDTGNTGKKRRQQQSGDLPGFYVTFTDDNPHAAQQICSELTSMLLDENLRLREQVAQSTTDFLSRQLEEAKRNLDDQDSKLAAFKKQFMGQLPGDEENNLKILMGVNTQLDANTQALNRAQQDKAYTESILAQQLAAWKATQTSTNPQALEQQLASLQSQLITLQARYTDDHPDVAKAKHDIAELQRKLKEIDSGSSQETETVQKADSREPPEIRQLRMQIHQYEQVIAQASAREKTLQDQIRAYQGRVALSPAVEEQYKQLTRDYETAHKFYNDLLAKKSESEMQTDMERRQQGEQMKLLNPAILPDKPSFPNRWLFAGGGLGAGLGLGMVLTLWLELRDKSIRNEQDVLAVLELPLLASVPWIGTNGDHRNGGPVSRGRPDKEGTREPVEV
jgi:polysaccharide chain length determinant protein (PEP-CTERM system associated)